MPSQSKWSTPLENKGSRSVQDTSDKESSLESEELSESESGDSDSNGVPARDPSSSCQYLGLPGMSNCSVPASHFGSCDGRGETQDVGGLLGSSSLTCCRGVSMMSVLSGPFAYLEEE